MTVATVDGDPPLPPEHIHHATCVSDIIWDEKESKHPDASFIFIPNLPGTDRYGVNAVEQSNGRRNSDHEHPPPHQQRLHLRSETASNHSKTSPLSSTHTTTIQNTKNTKTTHATTPNAHTYNDCDATLTRRPPPLQPTALTHTTPPPHLLNTVPPQRIDFDALKASILEGLIRDQTKFRMMMPTAQPMSTTQPLMMKTETTDKTANTVPPQRIDFDALKASILEGLIRDQTKFRMMMSTTQMTTQPMTMMPTNTKTTVNTMPNDPTRSTVNAPTFPKPQKLPQTTTDAADAAKGEFPPMILTTMMQPPMPTDTNNETTEKTKTSNNPATDSTFHQPQLLLQSNDDDEEFTGDDLQTPLPTTTTKTTTENTKTTKKPSIDDPPKPQNHNH